MGVAHNSAAPVFINILFPNSSFPFIMTMRYYMKGIVYEKSKLYRMVFWIYRIHPRIADWHSGISDASNAVFLDTGGSGAGICRIGTGGGEKDMVFGTDEYLGGGTDCADVYRISCSGQGDRCFR